MLFRAIINNKYVAYQRISKCIPYMCCHAVSDAETNGWNVWENEKFNKLQMCVRDVNGKHIST